MKPYRCALPLILLATFTTAVVAQQGQSPLPALPADIPKDATIWMLLTDKTPAGQDAVWTTPDGTVHEFFQFNDRGRGPKTYSTYRLDGKGIVTYEETHGVDYMKNPVSETFAVKEGGAAWKNQSENGSQANAAGRFFVGLSAGPAGTYLLAQALLKNGGKLPLLPGGEASLRELKTIPVEANGKKVKAALYQIDGLDFSPTYLWLDADHNAYAAVQGWSGLIRQGYESTFGELLKAQEEVESARAASLAKQLTHHPTGDLVIKNVTLFDSATAKALPAQRVTVRGERIVSVEAENNQATAPGAQVVDGSGKMLLPGLWDMHQHLQPDNAFLDIAAGITTIRDLANSIDELGKLKKHIEQGEQIGPRIVLAGFIDGPGPYEGPVKVLAATPEEARERVDRYADLGYVQIKIYSSVKPELVPVIIDEAHKRGLRVSGHVPAGMTAEQFVRDGADEIQHMNFVFLNFWPEVTETRTPARFTEPGKRAAGLDLSSPQVNQFIALLKQHHTVIDPTMTIWEATYVDRPGNISEEDAYMFQRLPLQVQRGAKMAAGALPTPDAATDQLYRASYANFVKMVKKLYDNGITVVAGTDLGKGYSLHRELEIYNQAGIPAPEVLRMATLTAAQVMKRDGELGSIAPGKLADMILVNGDPTANISDIRKIHTVIRGGALMYPAELYPAMGVSAQ
ncbi:MAG TPA: amidohydrolase family protein [Candidatus Bathyarchaeia archaeon]|nr:amidohydrolase family protein [Candidatus Bathyarchaeia archaeon]